MHFCSDTNASTRTSDELEVRGGAAPTSSSSSQLPLYALVEYDDDPIYVQPKIISALQKRIPGIKIITTPDDLPASGKYNFLDWSTYEKLRFEHILENPTTSLSCSYIIRYNVPYPMLIRTQTNALLCLLLSHTEKLSFVNIISPTQLHTMSAKTLLQF